MIPCLIPILFLVLSAGTLTKSTNEIRKRPNHLVSSPCDHKRITMEGITGWAVDCSNRNLSNVPDNFPKPTLILNLSGNNIKSLTADDFSVLDSLYKLLLSNNQISGLKTNTFGALVNLRTLDLQGNRLPMNKSSYPTEVFKNLKNVTDLKLNNNINSPDDTFNYPSVAISYMKHLKHLSIDGLENRTFGKEILSLKFLTSLVLSGDGGYCTVINITADFFWYLPYLESVDLSECNILDIHKDAFEPLHHIISLDLSRNSYLGFDKLGTAFEGLANSKTIRNLQLNEMYISSSLSVQIKCPHFKFLRNTSLEHLEIDQNGIEMMEYDVIPLCMPQTIKHLSIRKNRLLAGAYTYEIFSLPFLEFLDASGQATKHSTIARTAMSIGKNIRTILYNNNAVYSFAGPARFLEYVTRLELKDNHCSHIKQDTFDYATSLEHLDLKNNDLSLDLEQDIKGNIFKNVHKLQTLNLNRNQIIKLPRYVFRGLKNLMMLDLGNNRLGVFNIQISHMNKLQTILLANNSLRTLEPNKTQELDKREGNLSISLLGNPLECSCQTQGFLKWLRSTHVNVINVSEYTCRCPFENGTENLCFLSSIDKIINYLDTHCSETSHIQYIIGGASSFLVAVLVVATGLVIRHYKWRLTYLYYLSNAKYGGYQRMHEFKKDAFISYADEDVDFVINRLIPELEEQRGFRLCVRHREFLPGVAIAENITNWIHACNHTVVILSDSFLRNRWCHFEFNIARMDNIYTNRDVILAVVYQAVDEGKLPPEIKEFKILNKDAILKYVENSTFWGDVHSAIKT